MTARYALIAGVMAAAYVTGARAWAAPSPKRAVAVLEYRSGASALAGIEARVAAILQDKTSLAVVDVDEARRRFGPHLDRRVVACGGNARCLAMLGRKLGVREVMLIGVSEFGDVILTLQRIDVAKRRVVARVAEALAPGSEPDGAELLGYLQRVLPKSDFLRFGVIRIDANVEGATVVIDERARGKTPVEPVRVRAPATYEIRLTKSGYVPFRASVAVPPDAEVEVEPVLTPKSSDVWYKRWWVLTIAGTVVAGSVAAVLLTRDGAEEVPVTIQPF